MKLIVAVSSIILSTVSLAGATEPLAEWQVAAQEKVKEYARVKNAQWQSKTLLWLFADKANIAWDNIADQVSCNHLRAAGMPEGSRVMVAFYDNTAATQGKAERMGYALCK